MSAKDCIKAKKALTDSGDRKLFDAEYKELTDAGIPPDDAWAIAAETVMEAMVGDRNLLAAEIREKNGYVADLSIEELLNPDKPQVPAKTVPVEPESTPSETGTVLGTILTTVDKIFDGGLQLDEFLSSWKLVIDEADSIMAELSTQTKKALLDKMNPYTAIRYKSDKKDAVVDAYYDDIASNFLAPSSDGSGISYTMDVGDMKGSRARAMQAKINDITQEDLDRYAKEVADKREANKEKRAELTAGMENPVTIEDYTNLIQHIGRTNDDVKTWKDAWKQLTPEQRQAYDKLSATASRAKRTFKKDDQRTQVSAAGQLVSGEIIETTHTKKGHDLFVVQLAERVDRDDFLTLKNSAKRIGGYYSSYRGGGATPGFTFTEREQAVAFVKLAAGDTSEAKEVATTRRDTFKDDRAQTAVERLRDMAESLDERANESLAADRKTNTQRRAGMAARAEAQAEANKAMAETMVNIASGIEAGNIEYLDQLRTKTQVEMLDTFIGVAKYDEGVAKFPDDYQGREVFKDEPATIDTVEYARFPYYEVWRGDLARMGREIQDLAGTKLLGSKLLKLADDSSKQYEKFAKENMLKVATFSLEGGETAVFGTKKQAEAVIQRSGFRGTAIALQVKRGQHRIVLSPTEAQRRGIWEGREDTRVTLSPDFATEILTKVSRKSVGIPWQLESAHDKRKRLKSMNIETPAEFRAALMEYVELKKPPAAPDKIKEMERAMVGRRNDGMDFFPTPAGQVDEMIETADIREGMAVLEPSAGMGHIAEQIRQAGVEPDVIEISNERKELLEAKGFNVVGRDFMEFGSAPTILPELDSKMLIAQIKEVNDATEKLAKLRDAYIKKQHDGTVSRAATTTYNANAGNWAERRDKLKKQLLKRVREYQNDGFDVHLGVDDIGLIELDTSKEAKPETVNLYDRILMNPPFSDRRDSEHIQHAYTLLKPGGRLVALVGEGVFFGRDKRATAFRDWVESLGGTDEKLDEGTFMDPNLPVNTGVNARMVVIDKPTESEIAYSRKNKPFYSELTRQVENLQQPKAPAQQWLATINKLTQKGVKPEEIQWSGIEEWLSTQDGSISKDAVVSFLRSQEVIVEEVVKGENTLWVVYGDVGGESAEMVGDQVFESEKEAKEYAREVGIPITEDSVFPDRSTSNTQYSGYQMPGGDEYREMLLTVPVITEDITYTKPGTWVRSQRKAVTDFDEVRGGYETGEVVYHLIDDRGDWSEQIFSTKAEADAAVKVQSQTFITAVQLRESFTDAHFDEPNIVVWMRFKTQIIDGLKTLVIEEIQSALHQKGRKEGYSIERPKLQKELDKLREKAGKRPRLDNGIFDYAEDYNRGLELEAMLRDTEKYPSINLGAVPDAPFKKSWPLLAMKRMIRYAAENGFDQVAWTPGQVQADRYDLSKQISSVRIINTKSKYPNVVGAAPYKLVAYDKGGYTVIEKDLETKEAAEDYIGKEAAKKLLSDSSKVDDFENMIEGEDLKVGGEGMKGFYDKILPKEVGKFIKKWGSKVGVVAIEGQRSSLATPTDTGLDSDALREALKEYMQGNISTDEANDQIGYNLLTEDDWFGNWEGDQARDKQNLNVAVLELEGRYQAQKPVAEGTMAHSVTITEPMRESAMRGFPMFRRGTGTGTTIEQVNTWLSKPLSKLGKWVRVRVEIVQSVSELPGQQPSDIVGAFHDGTVYLVADNITDQSEAAMALAHEVVGHLGLEDMLGPKAFHKLMGEIESLKRTGNQTVLDIIESFRGDYLDENGNYTLDSKQEAREVMAHLAENNPNFGFMRRVWNQIKLWLSRNGFGKLFDFDAANLESLLIRAARHTQTDYTDNAPRGTRVRNRAAGLLQAEEAYSRKGLDMSKEDRLKRAREQGFNTETVYYHATQGSFSEFDASMGDVGVHFGTLAAAKSRASQLPDRGSTNYIQVYLLPEKDFIRVDGDPGRWEPEKLIKYLSKGTIKKLWEGNEFLSKSDLIEWKDIKTKALVASGMENESAAEYAKLNVMPIALGTHHKYYKAERVAWVEFLKGKLKAKGKEGFIYKNAHEGEYADSLVVFDPTQIRSVNAAFDPNEAESGNILHSRKSARIGMQKLAAKAKLFQYPVSQSRDMVTILKETSAGSLTAKDAPAASYEWYRSHQLADETPIDKVWSGQLSQYDKAGNHTADRNFDIIEAGDVVWLNVSTINEGKRGSMIYSAVANYAYNTGKLFTGDPAGITPIAFHRRLENMISSALKFGTTRHIEPHPIQRGDFTGYSQDNQDRYQTTGFLDEWQTGDHDGNIEQMLDLSYNNAYAYILGHPDEDPEFNIPPISEYRFDPETDEFRTQSDSSPLTESQLQRLAGSPRSRAIGAGSTTIKRALLTQFFRDNPGSSKKRLSQWLVEHADERLSEQLEKIAYSRKSETRREKSPRRSLRLAKASREIAEKGVTTFREQMWGAVNLRQISEQVHHILPTIQDEYVADLQRMETIKNRYKNQAGDIAEKRRKTLDDKQNDQLSKVQHETTIAGIDPDVEYQALVGKEEARDKIKVLNERIFGRPGSNKTLLMDEVKNIKRQLGQEKNRLNAREEIQAMWDKLSEKQKAIYREERDFHTKLRAEQQNALLERIELAQVDEAVKSGIMDKLRQQFEANSVEAPYFPLARFGKYFVYSSQLDPETGEPQTFYDMFETAGEWARHKADVMEGGAGKVLGAGRLLDKEFDRSGIDPEFVGQVDSLLATLGDSDQITEMRDSVYQLYLQALPELSARKHAIHRSKMRGFYLDHLRAFANSAQHGANMLGRLKFAHRLQATLDEAKKSIGMAQYASNYREVAEELKALEGALAGKIVEMPDVEIKARIKQARRDGDDAQYKLWQRYKDIKRELAPRVDGERSARIPIEAIEKRIARRKALLATADRIKKFGATPSVENVMNELTKTQESIVNPDISPWAAGFNALGFVWYLGFSLGAGIVNMSQTFAVGIPVLGAKLGWRETTKHMTDITARVVAMRRTDPDNVGYVGVEKQLKTPGEVAAFKRWHEEGLLNDTLAHDLQGISDAGINTGQLKHKFMGVMAFVFHHAERLNREITALSAYRAAITKGQSPTQAAITAEKLTWKAHFDYSQHNRARFMRGNWMRVITQFKQYSQNISYLYLNELKRSITTMSPYLSKTERKEARKALFGMLVMQSIFAGALGLPLANTFMWIAEALIDTDDDDPRDLEAEWRQWMADHMGKTTGRFVAKGAIDAWTPFSMHGRLTLSDLWLRTSDRELRGTAGTLDLLKAILGPQASIWSDFIMGSEQAFKGNTVGEKMRGVERMVPKWVRDPMKAARFAAEDAKSIRGIDIKEMSPQEVVSTLIGLSSSDLADTYDQTGAIRNIEIRRKARKSTLTDQLVNAELNGTASDKREARKKVVRWNKLNPQNPITGDAIESSMVGRDSAARQMVQGVRRTKANTDLIDRLNFAAE